MEIKSNRQGGEDFERHLGECEKDPKRPRNKGRELGILVALQKAIDRGYIDFSMVNRAFDFGAGYGGPTSALKAFLPEGAILEAAEVNPAKAAQMVYFGIIGRERIYRDGFRFLKDKKRIGKSLDLITAFMFGPEEEGLVFGRFASNAARVLSPIGQIILTSDEFTLGNIMHFCNDRKIAFMVNQGVRSAFTMESIPSTLHIPSQSLNLFRRRNGM